MQKVILDEHYISGMRDARDGRPAKSNHPNYERGYAAQYQLDQITQGMNNASQYSRQTV